MKFGVVVFPGSNCDRDIHEALINDLATGVNNALA
jgi:phosphoribosylformylglycinamidine synthase